MVNENWMLCKTELSVPQISNYTLRYRYIFSSMNEPKIYEKLVSSSQSPKKCRMLSYEDMKPFLENDCESRYFSTRIF